MFGKAELAEAYEGLKSNHREYAKQFALTLVSHISALSQDIGLYTREESDLIPGSIGKLVSAVPVAGKPAEFLISVINQVSKLQDAAEFKRRIKAVQGMFKSSFGTHEDVSIFSGHAGLKMLSKRKEQISQGIAEIQDHGSWFRRMLNTEMAQNTLGEDTVKEGLIQEGRAYVLKKVFRINSDQASNQSEDERRLSAYTSDLASADATKFLAEMLDPALDGSVFDEDLIKELVEKVLGSTETEPTPETESTPETEPTPEARVNCCCSIL